MTVFVNERSLEAHNDWGEGLKFFWEAAKELSGQAELYRDSYFFEGANFKQRFGPAIAGLNPEIRQGLRQVAFSERYWKCWRSDRVSEEDEAYMCQQPIFTLSDASLCEAAERKFLNGNLAVGVVSAADSAFAHNNQLRVSKNNVGQVALLPNGITTDAVLHWLAHQRGHYDRTSASAPKDFQTVLVKDAARFRRTHRVEPGFSRRIYEDVQTGQLLYVDEGHPGHSAHLEVFDADGNHVGEADIVMGAVDTSKCDNKKKITI